jgi:hypothetical protein
MAIGIGQRQFDQPPGLASGRPPEGNAEASQAHLLPADIRHLEPERREPVRRAWGGAGQFKEAAAQKVDHADHRAAVAILIEYPQTQDLLVEIAATAPCRSDAGSSDSPTLPSDQHYVTTRLGCIHRMWVAACKVYR